MKRETIGKVTKYNQDTKEVEIQLKGKIEEGDKLAILGPVAYELQEAKAIEELKEGKIKLKIDKQAREGTTVYKVD